MELDKMDKNTAIVITKDNRAFLNFDKPVGALLVAKISEIFEIMDNDVSKDRVDVVMQSEEAGKVQIKK